MSRATVALSLLAVRYSEVIAGSTASALREVPPTGLKDHALQQNTNTIADDRPQLTRGADGIPGWEFLFDMEMFPSTSGALARVAPRAARGSGEVLRLETLVSEAANGAGNCTVVVLGEPGSGKTTALRHLMSVFAARTDIRWFDEPTSGEIGLARQASTVVLTGTSAPDLPDHSGLPVFRVAPWGQDEWIEYVLHSAKERCASVMGRVFASSGRDEVEGLPEIWAALLDEFIADEDVTDLKEALRRAVARRVGGAERLPAIADQILHRIRTAEVTQRSGFEQLRAAAKKILVRMGTAGPPAALVMHGICRHASVRTRIAADRLVERVCAGDIKVMEGRVFPRLVCAAAAEVTRTPMAHAAISVAIETEGHRVGRVGASLLCCAGIPWRPTLGRRIRLGGALLHGVRWDGVSLRGVSAQHADLSRADLSRARLDDADLTGANFREAMLVECSLDGAVLVQAHLARVDARKATLFKADVRRAVLERAVFDGALADECGLIYCRAAGASFVRASLRNTIVRQCDFEGADLSGADFSGATLTGLTFSAATLVATKFTSAVIRDSSFAGVELPAAEFGNAVLENVDFTGSVMRNANFAGARMTGCGLADVWWEKADLTGADFRGCTFHMGTSRSGLVFSPIACEGSRTGFCTDDYSEQDFKPLEEISKADLRGADMTDANIEGVDFYLVDLRGAKYDFEQGAWFKKCGAILQDRA